MLHRKIVVSSLILVIIAVCFVGKAFALNYNVQANNNNNNGYIFVATGQKQGGTEIGTWKDPTTISTLKGDKGENGKDGYTPIKNVDYFDGKDGINGLNGINGIDGKNGIDGLNGKDGKDVDPITVTNLQNADNLLTNNLSTETTNRINEDNILSNSIIVEKNDRIISATNLQNNINTESTTRAKADTQLNSRINDTNNRVDNLDHRVSKLEKTQYNLRTEIKFIREKHLEVGVYSVYSTTRNVCAEVGLNVVIPIGESYQDRENKKINARLDRLEQKVGTATVIERTLDSKGHLKSISIGNGQIAVNGEF